MLRLLSLVATAVAALYVLEFTGVVKEREYFPSLPRLEASAHNPASWMDAASWGLDHLPDLPGLKMSAEHDTAPAGGKFTDRVAAKRKPSA